MSEPTGSTTAVKEDVILRVKDLHTYFYTEIGVARALNIMGVGSQRVHFDSFGV